MTTEYDNCISYNTQYPYCPLPLRIDSRRGCPFACEYCFSNTFLSKIVGHEITDYSKFSTPANVKVILKKFKLAGHEQETEDMEVQSIQHGLPVHFGGTADPFYYAEKQDRATLSILHILNEHNYPTVLSTKGTMVSNDEYVKKLNMPLVLQITLTTLDEKIANIMEPNAPTPQERLTTIKELSDMGFYVTVRNEPYFPFQTKEYYQNFFDSIADAGAKHVSCAPVRMYSKRLDAFKAALGTERVNYALSVSEGYMGYKRLKRSYVLQHSTMFKGMATANGMTYGGAGDNDSLMGDSFCCCFPIESVKGFENISKYNLYYAARLAKKNGKVTLDDISKEWHPEGKMYTKAAQSYTKELPQWQSVHAYFEHQWNRNKSSGMVLDDVQGIHYIGDDGNGNAMYAYEKEETKTQKRLI